ncbi:MAG: 16S rRNA (adenine(1518)-N(6)/adenine(1519)-N(6))-dimethyltransferase RsmA [Xanthomonadales bacterium]|nr:16S rRNA (adenine(1518)-N(6)/adenine(1519)-N(6))-dimethyltransferase RsmA [Xanthomonadales bacterium]NIX12259.1 16S rRNA (adenine(1518)-N(6)/adenine(1519)-N(6))-dimethyltransferase RsmA [Xanthomonadales bacterium]
MKHRARRRFGQNFLTDDRVIGRIVEAIDPGPGDLILEIGPGRGALTAPLVASGAEVHALEIDRDLARALSEDSTLSGRLTVHECDALKVNTGDIAGGRPYRLAGNLPYNISTPLLFHVLEQDLLPRDMHFMLQNEVVVRIAAAPGGRDYGRLSVMSQNRCRVTPLFTIGPESFQPRPRVQSRLVRMEPLAEPLSGAGLIEPLASVVKAAFAMRRKTLRNSLCSLFGEDELLRAGVDPGLRAEQVGLEQFIALAGLLGERRD